LKHFFLNLISKWNLIAVPALVKLGFWGVGLIALIDSSTLPVPMDALLAVYVWNNQGRFWIYCLMAAAGSAIGGLLPYGLGRRRAVSAQAGQSRALRADANAL